MTEEQPAQAATPPLPTAPTAVQVEQGIQNANVSALEKGDPLEAGIQRPVKMEGPADKNHNPFNERVDPTKAAPTAAPIQQIAPVSANGEKTSARTSMQADAPAEIVQASQTGVNEVPSAAQPANPVVPPVNSQPEETVEAPVESEPEEVPFDKQDPLQQADNLLRQVPSRMRLY